MEALRPDLERFLAASYPGGLIHPIAGDASTRRFLRLALPGSGTVVVMDYGQPFERETDDMRLERIFRRAGLRVARILAASPEAGCLVLEDLGERSLETALSECRARDGMSGREGAEALRERLYRRAIELAVAVAVRGSRALAASDRAQGPALDSDRFRFEMDFFIEHYVRGLRALEAVPPDLVASLRELADRAAASSHPAFCHRDYHSRNLMVLDDGTLAMVDIQDARWGPDSYDLASLLYDAYAEMPDSLRAALADEYRLSLPDPEAAEPFRARLRLVACQRMIKALGTFGYQSVVRGRHGYLEGVPRTLERLSQLLPACPEASKVARWFENTGLLAPL